MKEKKKIRTKKQIYELQAVAKILDNLWENSYYSMGQRGVERIELELIYYFGKNWTVDMYKFMDETDPNNWDLIKTLKEIK